MDNQFKSIFDGLGDKLKGLTDLFSKGFTAAFRAEGLERIEIGLGQIPRLHLKKLQLIHEWSMLFNAWYRENRLRTSGQCRFYRYRSELALVFLAESIANGLGRQKSVLFVLFSGSIWRIRAICFTSAGNIAQAFADGFYDVITSTGAVHRKFDCVCCFSYSSWHRGDWFQARRWPTKRHRGIVTDNMPSVAEAFSNALSAIAPIFESAEKAINDLSDSIRSCVW